MPAYQAKPHQGFAGYDLPEANGILGGVRRISQSLAVWSAERRAYNEAVRELSALSDRDLADIGLSRFDIEAVAREAAKAKTDGA
jgi:uncharacterized protein YjiS (DUF1127 family)